MKREMAKYKIRNIGSTKTFYSTWEGNTLPKGFFIFRRTPLYAPMFPISLLKRSLWSY